MSNISKCHGQVLSCPITPLQTSLIFYLQVGGYLSCSAPTSIRHLTPRALGEAQSPHSPFPISRPASCWRKSQSFLQIELPWILVTLKAHTWPTSSRWAEAAGGDVQWLMDQRRPEVSGEAPPTRNQSSSRRDQTAERGP